MSRSHVTVEMNLAATAELFTRAVFPRGKEPTPAEDGGFLVATKYLKACAAARKKAPGNISVEDKFLFGGRPALGEFMTSLEDAAGGVREPSVLMLGAHAEGIRAGLKDEDMGGWCWRVGKDLPAALDALEKALQEGTAVFSSGAARRQKK